MELIHEELSGQIIAAAITVQQGLRPGLNEKIYEKALCIELTERGISFEQQARYDVFYKGQNLGYLIPDLVVENKIIVDPKCVELFTPTHDAQMLGYLNITGLDLALLLNFKVWPLGKNASSDHNSIFHNPANSIFHNPSSVFSPSASPF